MGETGKQDRFYVGVDVGGTKIQGLVVREDGTIARRERQPTPRDGTPDPTLAAIEKVISNLREVEPLKSQAATAIGIAIPGVVDPDQGRVVVTPNMNLSGVEIVPRLESKFAVPVALGNDCNLGTLGEKWLGSARDAASAVGIFVGTGIGGGFVQEGKLWRGSREAALEIGHMIMQIDGPRCGCGNKGCLEALASRTAIEREIREAVKRGRKTVLTELLDGDLSVIRSGALKEALDRKDKLVTTVLRRASEILGYACVTVRHLLDPEVIILGGGVMEACGDFMLAVVEEIVKSDRLAGARVGGKVLRSALGDDAVALGAVALAREHVGRSPFGQGCSETPAYPRIVSTQFGEITIGEKTYTGDVIIRVSGKVKKRKKGAVKKLYGTSHMIGPKELEKVCPGGPEILFIGTGQSGLAELTEDAVQYLRDRAIEYQALPTPQVIEAYNRCTRRKAALIHVTC